ncbi:MAG: hypothetical protein Kow00109_15850 [Acidobacteriota bacterium]
MVAPGTLQLQVPFEAAWQGIQEVLEENGWTIAEQDRTKGTIVTAEREYISGPLTRSQLEKVAELRPLADGDWLEGRLRYEITVQLIAARETQLAVSADFRALARSFFGEEKWYPLRSRGVKEAELLLRLGRRLFGDSFELDPSSWDWLQVKPPTLPAEGRDPRPHTSTPEKP